MGPSSIRDAIFYGAKFKPATRCLIIFLGTSVAAFSALTCVHLGLDAHSVLMRWSWIGGGTLIGFVGCRATDRLQSQFATRLYWTGIEVNRLFSVRWYPWSEIIALSDDGTIQAHQRYIRLFSGLFAPKRTPVLADELVRRFEARVLVKTLQATITPLIHGGDITGIRHWRVKDWPAYHRIMTDPSIRTAHR